MLTQTEHTLFFFFANRCFSCPGVMQTINWLKPCWLKWPQLPKRLLWREPKVLCGVHSIDLLPSCNIWMSFSLLCSLPMVQLVTLSWVPLFDPFLLSVSEVKRVSPSIMGALRRIRSWRMLRLEASHFWRLAPVFGFQIISAATRADAGPVMVWHGSLAVVIVELEACDFAVSGCPIMKTAAVVFLYECHDFLK